MHNCRRLFILCSVLVIAGIVLASMFSIHALWAFVLVGPLIGLGLYDVIQTHSTLPRNFPVLAHVRFLFEGIRPEIQQYFIELDTTANPIEREFRSLVYQRAKDQLETKPFGTQRDVYRVGYEWLAHSAAPMKAMENPPRVRIGADQCKQPYDASLLNISAMSFGALSMNAIEALNRGAAKGGFAHNTGEGSVSPYHENGGGDLVWQIGTGYFGCRNEDGGFDLDSYANRAVSEQIKMIELKLSQGAKPGHGGVLPGAKVTLEIAHIRCVPAGETVISPPGHSAFNSPIGLIQFIDTLRENAAGKPVGFKLCLGRHDEFFAICKAMLEVGSTPDFITVDGGEGGTGAAPLEFSNSVGMPGRDGLVFVHNALRGVGLRDKVKIINSGKILTGFHMIRALALGADLCNSARGFMLALGCIQALRCNSNHCPTGVATQNVSLTKGLVVTDKAERVTRFHERTVEACLELLGAMGLSHPDELTPRHVFRRVEDMRICHYGEVYSTMEPGQLLDGDVPEKIKTAWVQARADRWV